LFREPTTPVRRSQSAAAISGGASKYYRAVLSVDFGYLAAEVRANAGKVAQNWPVATALQRTPEEVIDGQKCRTVFANAWPGHPIATLSRGCARLVF
jgi:hypothetical protein